MTIANGRSISVPWSLSARIGSSPKMVVAAVIILGRTRPMLASRNAVSNGLPLAKSARVSPG